jgi:hypothetical protein
MASVRKYKKAIKKQRCYICRDDYGRKIFVGDTLELQISHETRTSYKSEVYFNMIDGAFVDAHPAHIKMGLSTGHRNLRDYLRPDVEFSKYVCKKIY